MKPIKVQDVGQLRNELAKFRRGKKLTISQFNQVARLAWLGHVVLAPLDPDDPSCTAFLLYCERPQALAGAMLDVEEYLYARIHVLDAEQGTKLREILAEGIQARSEAYRGLNARDFYFDKFFAPKSGSQP